MSSKSNQGALKRAVGGAARRASPGRVASSPMREGSPQGALGRVIGRVASQGQNPQPMRGNHMVRNWDQTNMLAGADASLADTGDGLRKVVGRMGRRRIAAAKGGPISRKGPRSNEKIDESINYNPMIDDAGRASRRGSNQRYRVRKGDSKIKELVDFDRKRSGYAEGGKVGTAMTALRALAKKYQEALDSGDTMLARRLKKQLDSAGVKDAEEEVGNQKAATFSKGGKVKAIAKMFRARMDDREGYIREGKGATKEEAYEKLRKEVARDNGEDTVDALLKEHGVTYRGRE